MARHPGEPSWMWRRLATFALLLFGCWRIVAMTNAEDSRVNDTLAYGMIVMVMALAFTYIGFATVQDVVAIFATRSGLPYAPPRHGRRALQVDAADDNETDEEESHPPPRGKQE